MPEPSTLRGILDAFGFQIPAVQVNVVLLVAVIVATYWTRRVTSATAWSAWIDTAVCWFGPYTWALVYLALVGDRLSWADLATWAAVYAAFAGVAYALMARRLLEAAWGPVGNGQGGG